jgi:metal iron transporter
VVTIAKHRPAKEEQTQARAMDRRPDTQGGDANAADDSIGIQAPPPTVSFQEKGTDSKEQNARIAADIMLASVGGGDQDRNSLATSNGRSSRIRDGTRLARLKHVLITFGRFVGPGFMVSVAYSKFPSPERVVGDSDLPCDTRREER